MSELATLTAEGAEHDPMICPVCRQRTSRQLPGRIAPFIAERTGLEGEAAVSHFCEACEHVYLTPFYSREQLTAIYSGYRDDTYNSQRDRHEPGYLDFAPELSDPASQGYQTRRDFYDFFMGRFHDFKGVVVDYGGGDGYFSKYVFPQAEVVIADEDFERNGGDLDALLERADFFFATHVFEHLPQPSDVLQSLTPRLRPGTPVYVELPKPYLGRLPAAFEALERDHSEGKPFGWSDLLVLHEHLAHFSKRSAETLMRSAGLSCDEYYLHPAHMMGFLGRKER